MKIAIFSRSTVEHFTSGGMETHLKNLVEGLSKEGHILTVITTSHPDSLTSDKKTFENKIKYLYIGDTTPGLNPITFWENLFVAIKVMVRSKKGEGKKNYYHESRKVFDELNAKNPFDLVVSQSTSAMGVVNTIGIPIVSIIHGTIKAEIQNRFKSNRTLNNWVRFFIVDLFRWYFELFTSNKVFFERVNKIIAVSQGLKKQFLMDHPNRESKVEVIYNGVDAKLFKPGDSKYPIFTVLYIGRMDREKGVDLVIKAVEILKTRGVKTKAKLIGHGINIDELKRYSKEQKVDDRIEFLGQIENEKLIAYYQQSHVFLLPTRRNEGHPMTISEALCCGLPVIATRKGGLAELIEDNRNGFFVKDNDPIDIADKLQSIISDSQMLKDFSKNARKIAEKKFSRDAMIHRYLEVLNDLVKHNAKNK